MARIPAEDLRKGVAVVSLEGLSGTGKSTTVKQLKAELGDKAELWSNGVIFRSVTLLAKKMAEKQGRTLEEPLLRSVENAFLRLLCNNPPRRQPILKVSRNLKITILLKSLSITENTRSLLLLLKNSEPSGHYSRDWSEHVNVIGVISEPSAVNLDS